MIDLFLELQALDRVPRSGYAMRGVAGPESVAEHTFHTVALVWALSRRIDGIDRLRALEIALVHDLAEARLGDLPRGAGRYLPTQEKHSAERAASAEMLGEIAGASRLVREYQEQRTPEARLVKSCDRLQLLIKATVYQSWGAGGLDEFFDRLDGFDDGGFEPVRTLFDQLVARRRRQSEVQESRR